MLTKGQRGCKAMVANDFVVATMFVAVQCGAVLYCAVLFYAVLCYAMHRYTMLLSSVSNCCLY